MKEVIIQISGGLGNQLFMWAAAKALAIDLGASLIMDLQKYKLNSKRSYLLFELGIEGNNASLSDGNKNDSVTVINDIFKYENPILKCKKSDIVWLNGYFQSENYFKHKRELIRSSIKFSSGSKIKADNEYACFKNQHNIGICVRRGDYLAIADYHPVLPITYYKDAIALLNVNLDITRFFIFR